MVRHVVMWKVEESPDKADALQKLRTALESLKDKIEQIAELEIGIDFSQKDETRADIILVCSFASVGDLNIYQQHQEYLKVVKIIRSLTYEKRVADYNF